MTPPIETLVQLVSAVATAAAAIFAALSARSAALSAKEMERARELASAPVLTITPQRGDLAYYFDMGNGYDAMSDRNNAFALENHGNGPALNLLVHLELDLQEPPLAAEILLVESVGKLPRKCFAGPAGLRWESAHPRLAPTALHEEQLIVSLAKAEAETLTLSTALMRRWVLDAISYNVAKVTGRQHVAHLTITVTYDTVLQRALRSSFRFRLSSGRMPTVGEQLQSFSGGATYAVAVEPVPL
ncbi:hypothetical protein ACIQC9_07115 [Brevundimonas sp. NPDC092305]|uniref:hypothetical protein n=1 Tax=Brevundimonas sp. NPDC092305 TaxID=3363957 RepID=UPI0037F863FA